MTLEELGLHAKVLIAGFSGGVVYSLVVKHHRPISVVGSAVAGTLTANYLGPVAAHFGPDWFNDEGRGFVVGLTAMAICQGLVVLVSSRMRSATAGDEPSNEVHP